MTIDETATVAELVRRLTEVEEQLSAVRQEAARAADRGAVENLFSRYMHYHNAYEDQRIIDELWAKPGTPGIRARYNNVGVYTTYESVTAYHRGRPRPVGKLLLHYTTTPVIEVGADGQTAKGLWLMAGTESGLTDPDVAENVPEWVFSGGEVDGKRVWAHWVWCKYGVDFVKQDGQWRIWHFRCYEIARAPFDRDWVSFASDNQESHDSQLAWFGDDGVPVFLPPVDGPVETIYEPYRNDRAQTLDPVPPLPYQDFEDTFQ
jgi:SnoaL-like domain